MSVPGTQHLSPTSPSPRPPQPRVSSASAGRWHLSLRRWLRGVHGGAAGPVVVVVGEGLRRGRPAPAGAHQRRGRQVGHQGAVPPAAARPPRRLGLHLRQLLGPLRR